MTSRVDAKGAIARLVAARGPGPAALGFDADGTLWAGDVGEDVFLHACDRGLLREAATPALRAVVARHGETLRELAGAEAPEELALGLFHGYRRGEVDERLMCEVMT
ncbi:MAG: hypothetical protein FJ104_10505, partial [Deltaproteobacteria bacterium]|nr:hypothetical protein [Deltaproteobacteria bacterium]